MDAKDLQIVRFTQPAMCSIIPPVLFEQLVEVDKDVKLDALVNAAAAGMANRQTYFFAFIDPEQNKVVGFVWMVHSVLKNRLVIFYMSFLPEYQGKGIRATCLALWKNMVATFKLDNIIELCTFYPDVAKRYGGTPSKTTVWEFDTTDPDYAKERKVESTDANDSGN